MATPYTIHNDVKYQPLELIDIARLQRETKEQWVNYTLSEVNEAFRLIEEREVFGKVVLKP